MLEVLRSYKAVWFRHLRFASRTHVALISSVFFIITYFEKGFLQREYSGRI